jgi:hypothetical protein
LRFDGSVKGTTAFLPLGLGVAVQITASRTEFLFEKAKRGYSRIA